MKEEEYSIRLKNLDNQLKEVIFAGDVKVRHLALYLFRFV